MPFVRLIVAAALALAAMPGHRAAAQTAAPGLPLPAVDDGAAPAAFLDAAQRAIAANRGGEAQEALERAESRALDRAVRPSKAGQPSRQPLVQQIAQARQALAAGDRQQAVALIQAAIANPEAGEPDQ